MKKITFEDVLKELYNNKVNVFVEYPSGRLSEIMFSNGSIYHKSGESFIFNVNNEYFIEEQHKEGEVWETEFGYKILIFKLNEKLYCLFHDFSYSPIGKANLKKKISNDKKDFYKAVKECFEK